MNEGLVMAKYNIYTSRLRNVFTSSSLGLALIGFSHSNLIEQHSKKYILFIGVCMLFISILYGFDNLLDYEKYVYTHDINKNTSLLDSNSIYNDITIIKTMLIMMTIFVLMIITNTFYCV